MTGRKRIGFRADMRKLRGERLIFNSFHSGPRLLPPFAAVNWPCTIFGLWEETGGEIQPNFSRCRCNHGQVDAVANRQERFFNQNNMPSPSRPPRALLPDETGADGGFLRCRKYRRCPISLTNLISRQAATGPTPR